MEDNEDGFSQKGSGTMTRSTIAGQRPLLHGSGLRYASHLGLCPGGAGLLRDFIKNDDPVAQVRAAEALGFSAVQDAWALERDERELNRIATAVQIAGLDGGSVLVTREQHLKTPIWVRVDAQSREEQRLVTLHAIHVAELMSSEVIVILPRRDPDAPVAEQIDIFAENLRWTAELASRRDIRIGLEPMRTVPGMLVTDLAQATEVIHRIDSGKAGLVFDTFHVHAEKRSVARAFVEHFNDILVLQIADHPDRKQTGSGDIEIAEALALARSMGFRGLVELEHDWNVSGYASQKAELSRLPHLERMANPSARPFMH